MGRGSPGLSQGKRIYDSLLIDSLLIRHFCFSVLSAGGHDPIERFGIEEMPGHAVGFKQQLPFQPAFRHDASEGEPDKAILRQRRSVGSVTFSRRSGLWRLFRQERKTRAEDKDNQRSQKKIAGFHDDGMSSIYF